jgi:hypothetical protein
VNPFAQPVEINGRMISLTTNMPTQLATLFSIQVEAEKALADTQNQVDKMEDVNRSATIAPALKTETEKLVVDCNAYYQQAKKIKEALALHARLAETLADKRFCNAAAMTQALAKRGVDAAAIKGLKDDFESFEHAYEEVNGQYGAATQKAGTVGDPEKEARIANAQAQIEKDYDALDDDYKKTLAGIDNLFANATDPGSYVVKSDPIKLAGDGENADEVEFAVKVGERSYSDAFPVRGGWKIDYSVGPAFNFISDHRYFKDNDDILRRAGQGTFFSTITPSVAAMMHVCRRTHTNFAVGWMFGVNAGFEALTDINLGFLGGASAVLGRSQKVIVSTGVSYLQVNRLKEGQYAVGQPYPDVPIEDVTAQVLRPSWFVAVSLNLSKRNVVKPTP